MFALLRHYGVERALELFIDYMLTEKCDDASIFADKQCIIAHLKDIFPSTTREHIVLQIMSKNYKLPYSISCASATDNCCNSLAYSIHLEYESSNNCICAQTLEKVHFAIVNYFNQKEEYHLIIANDGLSEYYCGKAYPEFQKFERLLRNLIFIVVTKAYGERWVDETFPAELKPKINKTQLIESALMEMTLGNLIDYLFYGRAEVDFSVFIDNDYPSDKLYSLSKDALISLIERGRRRSIWNNFLAAHINIERPKDKLLFIRDTRNKIAHCKQFYSVEYKQSKEYISLFITQIQQCIEKVSIKDRSIGRDVVLAFGEFTVCLAEMTKQIGNMIAPAIIEMAKVGQSLAEAMGKGMITAMIASATEPPQSIIGTIDAICDSLDSPCNKCD